MDCIDPLRLLIKVAETGSGSGVARQSMVAASTVALAIGQLEQEIGVMLITRSTRKLVFTHAWQALLADTRRIASDWDASLAGAQQDGPLAGPIRVTAANNVGRAQRRPLLDRFQ